MFNVYRGNSLSIPHLFTVIALCLIGFLIVFIGQYFVNSAVADRVQSLQANIEMVNVNTIA